MATPSYTPLPPSPELRPNGAHLSSDMEPLPFSLGGINLSGSGAIVGGDSTSPSRLRSIARYQAFSPQALACSDSILPSSFSASSNNTNSNNNEDSEMNGVGRSFLQANANARRQQRSPQSASLGAIAGAQGVAVFRISKPHEPLLMLNHATSNHANRSSHVINGNLRKTPNSPRNQQHPSQHQSQGGGGKPVTALAFQPDATRSLYLAAARGSGVLVWDVSGHSISPLLGRLAMDASVGGDGSGHIYSSGSDFSVTSLSWKVSAEKDGAPLLATTTNYSACIWDLRSPVATAKPSVRFGVKTKKINSNNSNNGGRSSSAVSPYVQISCSRSNECATLDAAGTVRVFDIRMTDQTRYSMNSLATFAAFAHRGVGISCLHALQAGTSEGRSTNWVTWGLDSPDADAVVKVWSSSGNGEADLNIRSDNSTHKTEDTYWYMDGSPGRISGVSPYRLIAQCSPPYHLACARVCPDPVENSIMTIGILDDNMGNTNKRGHDGWRAELWKIRPPTAVELDANDGTFGIERIVSFNGGAAHDACIESVLGRNTRIGQLQGAELAITSSTAAGLQNIKDSDDRIQDKNQLELGLALCCLSDKGYVTTHLIPEAMPQKALSKLGQTSPQLFSNGNRTKIFNDDREGAVDAASLWGTQGDRPTRVGIETRTTVERVRAQYQSSPTKESINQGAAPNQLKQRNSDGGMLFEMDVPAVAYGTAERMPGVQIGGPIDLTSPKAVATATIVEETNNAAAHVRDVAAMAERMDNIETERIPCPRICSAAFGPGVGGLAIFKNGDVKKMWTWYDRASSSRLPGIPSSISAPETAFSDPGSSEGLGSAGDHEPELKTSILREYPRSMKDLMDMTEAASEAQWGGEVNESGAADSQDEQEQSSNDNFFEYMSTGSISSDSDDNEPIEFESGKSSSRYENYFGNFRRPLAIPGGNTKQTEGDEQKAQVEQTESPGVSKVPVVGPSSDTLTPTVHVTHDFDKLALNNQSAELAKDWELGQWQTEEEVRARLSPGIPAHLEPNRHFDTLQEGSGMVYPPTSPTIQRGLPTGLPSYRRLTETPPKNNAIARSKSDSIVLPVVPALQNAQIENEHGVHGGEYAVRPNMQESMVFLRKLFSHQQEGNGFPNLLSPPDSPAAFQNNRKSLPNIAAFEQLRSQGEVNTRQSSIEVSAHDEKRARAQPGVYALATDAVGIHEDDRKLSQVRALCMHNASVCEKYGESGKQKVWLLLEQMVDRRLNEIPDAFNGWGGKGGGALGVDLVKNIMKYYETLGDVQMLATIVCVLSGGRPRNQEDDQLDLLPTGYDEKYDTYIRRYSDLLFGWSLLVKRAELNKHLTQRVQENEGSSIVIDTPANRLRAPGIELVFTCPRCGEDAANICRTCQDFAFRCSVCENGVRGLFMVCDSCGHGGHAGHINSWFAKHSECPSGCGCLCTFSSRTAPSPVQNDVTRMPTFIEPLGD